MKVPDGFALVGVGVGVVAAAVDAVEFFADEVVLEEELFVAAGAGCDAVV